MESRNEKEQLKHQLHVVEIALRRWDPIDVISDLVADGLPPNEYDSYAPSVLSTIHSAQCDSEISNNLAGIRHNLMGLGGKSPTERETDIGEKLLAWKNTGFEGTPDFRFMRY